MPTRRACWCTLGPSGPKTSFWQRTSATTPAPTRETRRVRLPKCGATSKRASTACSATTARWLAGPSTADTLLPHHLQPGLLALAVGVQGQRGVLQIALVVEGDVARHALVMDGAQGGQVFGRIARAGRLHRLGKHHHGIVGLGR